MAIEGGDYADAALARDGGLARRLRDLALAERDRWPLWLPVLMGAGIGVYFWLPREPSAALGPTLLAAALLLLVVAMRNRRSLVWAAALAAPALGFGAAQLQAELVAAPVLAHRIGPVTVSGRIESVDPLPEGARLVIAPTHIDGLGADGLPARVRVRLRRGDAAAIPGASLAVRAMLMPPPAPDLPGDYDFAREAWFERLGAVGYALGAPRWDAAQDGGASAWRVALGALRTRMTERIRAAVPGPDGAIAAALITGDTHAIPPADAQAFRDAGLAHILVIAGLHMGMVAGIGFFALRALFALIPRMALYLPTKKYAAGGALALAFLYMLLSGATVSSRRAFAMIGLALVAVMLDRVSISARAVALAAASIMLLTPESVAGPSFQMSFAAVVALIACYEAMRPRLAEWRRAAGWGRRAALYLFGIALTSVVTTAATMPFTIYHFNRFPLYGVAANAVAVPITGFWVMPWAIVSVLLMPLGLDGPALAMMGHGVDAVAAVARAVAGLPGAVATWPSMPPYALMLMGLGGLWLAIWRGPWRVLGLAPVAAGWLAATFVQPPDLIVANDARYIAARAADGVYLPSTAAASRALAAAARRVGASMGAPWPDDGSAAGGALTCDAEACLYRAGGAVVALERDGAALAEDCRSADLVISPVASRRACHGPPLIDRIDVWEKGAHAIWLDGANIRVETVRDWQGARPWSARAGADFQ